MFSSSALPSVVKKGHSLLIKVAEALQPVILLLFRLHWGWQFFQTGKGKLLNHENVVQFFTSLGIPAPEANAWFVGAVECVGGLFLMFGLAGRPVGFVLAANMIVAYLSVPEDRATVSGLFTDPEPFLNADPFFFLLASLLVFAFGAGSFSLDALLKRFFEKRRAALL